MLSPNASPAVCHNQGRSSTRRLKRIGTRIVISHLLSSVLSLSRIEVVIPRADGKPSARASASLYAVRSLLVGRCRKNSVPPRQSSGRLR